MSASVSVADEIVTTAESERTPATPMPTPSSAVRMGIPAASSEPKVTSRTSSATTTPTSSVGPRSSSGSVNGPPATATVKPSSLSVLSAEAMVSRVASLTSSAGTVNWMST